jgi:hypothetical protein
MDKEKRTIQKQTCHRRINQSNDGRWNRSRSVILTRHVRKRDNHDRCCHEPSPIRDLPLPRTLAYLAGRINRIVSLGRPLFVANHTQDQQLLGAHHGHYAFHSDQGRTEVACKYQS